MTLLAHSQIRCSTASSWTVRTPSDEQVGEIKDFILNTHSGEVSYVVLQINEGFLNLGSKLLALPWESFEFNTAQDEVVIVKESKETLENSPGFDEDNWPTGPQSEFIQSIHTYYGQENRSLYGAGTDRHDQMTDHGLGERRLRDERIGDHQSGSSFLERDRSEESLTSKRGGNPII